MIARIVLLRRLAACCARAAGAAVLALALAPALALSLQIGEGPHVEGSGNAADEVRQVGGFSALTIEGPVDVQLKAGERERVTVHADDNIVPLISTEVQAGRLVVGMKPSTVRTRTKMLVTVEFTQMSGILIRGSGDVRGDTIKTAIFEAVLRGSGDVVVDRIEADAVALSVAGSGDFTAGGKANSLGVNVMGSGDVRTENLEARQVAVRIRGSGDVRVHAVDTLTVDIAGSGDVRYRGTPQIMQKKAGSGEVRPLK